MKKFSILHPKNDIIFKLFFGDERNIDLLKDFLKPLLNHSHTTGTLKKVRTAT